MKLETDPGRAPLRTSNTRHDRLLVSRSGSRTLIAIADRMTREPNVHGSDAADRTAEELARCFERGVTPGDPRDWEMILQGIDQSLLLEPGCGEAGALVMLIEGGKLLGASVGGTSLSMAGPHATVPVSKSSVTGPGLGSGFAVPIGFGPVPLLGRLVTRRPPRPDDTRAPALRPLFRPWAEAYLHA